MGQMWSAMTNEEKQQYHEKASLERERVSLELKAWEDEHGEELALLAKAGDGKSKEDSDGPLIYPLGRIRKICKLDPEVRGISKEGLLCLTKAAEMFTALIGDDCVRVAQIQNRRKLSPYDIVQVCESRDRFEFLRDDIKDLTRLQQNDQDKTKATAANNKKPDLSSNNRTITSYFTAAATSKPSV